MQPFIILVPGVRSPFVSWKSTKEAAAEDAATGLGFIALPRGSTLWQVSTVTEVTPVEREKIDQMGATAQVSDSYLKQLSQKIDWNAGPDWATHYQIISDGAGQQKAYWTNGERTQDITQMAPGLRYFEVAPGAMFTIARPVNPAMGFDGGIEVGATTHGSYDGTPNQVLKAAPRVTQEDVDKAIQGVQYTLLQDGRTTIALLTLDNGFTVRGESSCVCIENYDREKGEEISKRRAVDQVWMLLGFRLADRLHQMATAAQTMVGANDR